MHKAVSPIPAEMIHSIFGAVWRRSGDLILFHHIIWIPINNCNTYRMDQNQMELGIGFRMLTYQSQAHCMNHQIVLTFVSFVDCIPWNVLAEFEPVKRPEEPIRVLYVDDSHMISDDSSHHLFLTTYNISLFSPVLPDDQVFSAIVEAITLAPTIFLT